MGQIGAIIAARISSLSSHIAPEFRDQLQAALRAAVGKADDVPQAFTAITRFFEGERGLLAHIASASNYKIKKSLLEEQIEELQKKAILPGEIASDLHWIRVRANKARHHAETAKLTADAGFVLERALRVVEWFYCECERGPRLPTIYQTDPLLHGYATNMLEWPRLRPVDGLRLELSARRDAEQRPLSEWLLENRRLVLFGSPGGGKTVFLLKTFKGMCVALRDALRQEPPLTAPEVPVFAELGLLPTARSLVHLILSQLGLRVEGDAPPVLADLLEGASFTLFLDGLNELPEALRHPCAQQLVELHRYLRARGLDGRLTVVATTRPYGFSARLSQCFRDEGYALAEVLPLSPEQIAEHFRGRLSGPPEEAQAFFDALGTKVRHLFSNPQHLSYALEWYEDQRRQGGGVRHLLRTRGALLNHCIRNRLGALSDPATAAVAETILRRLACDANQGGVYFPLEAVRRAAVDALGSPPSPEAARLIDEIRQADLLLPSKDHQQFRFPHHSQQQFFAACEMKARWQTESGTYIRSELWHEPLVIMAGLLADPQVRELLATIRPNRQLYAYVLANVDQPDIEARFQRETADGFSRTVRFWARGMAWLLILLFGGWFFSLPFLAWWVYVYCPGYDPAALAGDGLALVYLIAFPVGLRWAYRRWFAGRLTRLREQTLPQLLTVLKYLDAKGALLRVQGELASLRAKLISRPDDPRWAFLSEADAQITQALQARSFLTEDEMLLKIGDPLVAVVIDVETLSEQAIDKLVERAGEAADGPWTPNLLAVLRELYAKRADHRERLAGLFSALASDLRYSRRRRRTAAVICRSLTISYRKTPSTRPGILTQLFHFLRRLMGLPE